MKNIHPDLDPPATWSLYRYTFFGASAARERAILDMMSRCEAHEERKLLDAALRELYASAWEKNIPEEDREWAKAYRHVVDAHRRGILGRSARKAYLESSGEAESPCPRSMRENASIDGAWSFFAACVETAGNQSELATAKSALCGYWEHFWMGPGTPWESDPAQVHWLAAVRAVRAALATWAPRKN